MTSQIVLLVAGPTLTASIPAAVYVFAKLILSKI